MSLLEDARRAGNRDLFLIDWRDGNAVPVILESGSGPANVTVVNDQKQDLVLVANRDIGEVAVFIVSD